MMPARTHEGDLDRIARALRGKRLGTGGWSCRCPAHEDRHSSLSLSIKDGRLLWHCHAGCTQAQVRAALEREKLLPEQQLNGARITHLRPVAAKPNGSGRHGDLGRIEATYDYVDLDGTLKFQVVRFVGAGGKTFRQRRPKGRDRWEWGLGRTEPFLYRLSDVMAAETVYVAEGEKDVDRLFSIGLTATTSPMGAGKWRMAYGEYLAGKHVVVLPDNDEVGRRHAEDVAASARAAGARSIRLVLLPGLAEHGDVSDWLDAGGTRAKLEQLAREAPRWGENAGLGDAGWRARLKQGDRGYLVNEANIRTALAHAPELAGRIRLNGLSATIQCRDLPWDQEPAWRDFEDADEKQLTIWLQDAGLDVKDFRVRNAVVAVAQSRFHHPIREYLCGLKWDGTARLDDWLNVYLGAAYLDDSSMRLTRAFAAKFLIGAVARVFEPGCKMDTALILEGRQGAGKSTALETLFGTAWFTDQISDLGSKDASGDLRGKWGIEFPELKNVRGAEVERVKAFLSRKTDHYRLPYGVFPKDVPRQCVFMGSTNEDIYLHDTTGNRRFWPVRVGLIDLKNLQCDRDHLWAEAKARYDTGEQWWLTKNEEALASFEQGARVEEDVWAEVIDEYLEPRQMVKIEEILSGPLNIPRDRWDQKTQGRVRRHLQNRGWKKKQVRFGGPRDRMWCKPEKPA